MRVCVCKMMMTSKKEGKTEGEKGSYSGRGGGGRSRSWIGWMKEAAEEETALAV